ncbi:hypothetical protein D1872_322600 [compost metagenome]
MRDREGFDTQGAELTRSSSLQHDTLNILKCPYMLAHRRPSLLISIDGKLVLAGNRPQTLNMI